MTLSREVYQAIQDVVGSRNITQEPAIMDAYAFNYTNEIWNKDCSRFNIRPIAAVLPGSAEEVQAIVKLCNRYRVKFKAFSTGWGRGAGPAMEDVVQLDLRRMDRILEIDAKNMYAVIEPYVMGGILQIEAMKLGLNCNFPGAGAAVSPLANSTSGQGHGPPSIYFGHNSEVILGLEWVLPDGEILHTGSLSNDKGWFCGEGPGPSLRAFMRGAGGASGNVGVFTKVAVKLVPWPGPKVLPAEGTAPAYHMKVPDNFRVYTLAFPSWESFIETALKLYDAEIGYVCHRQWHKLGSDLSPAFFSMYVDPTRTLDDMEAILKDPEMQSLVEEMRNSLPIVLAGQTPHEIQYQDKVLDQILQETGGHKVAKMSEKEMEEFCFLYLIRWGHKALNFVYAGGYAGSFHQYGSPDFNLIYAPVAEKVLAKHQATGKLVQCGGDALMGPIARMGGGGTLSLEQFITFDPAEEESVEEVRTYMDDAAEVTKQHGITPGFDAAQKLLRLNREQRNEAYAKSPDHRRFEWQWKVKHMLDPNEVTEDMSYPMVKPEENA